MEQVLKDKVKILQHRNFPDEQFTLFTFPLRSGHPGEIVNDAAFQFTTGSRVGACGYKSASVIARYILVVNCFQFQINFGL